MEEYLKKIIDKLDTLLIIELTKSGLTKKQVANVLKISDHTIDTFIRYTELRKYLKIKGIKDGEETT